MPEYLTPGVYIEEIERGPRPIEGVPTSTAAFLGETERGPIRPRLITSYKEYRRWFGGVFHDGQRFLPHAANGFFENGGKRLYLCRIVGQGAKTASKEFGDFIVTAVGPGAWGSNVWINICQGSTKADNPDNTGFRMQLAYWSIKPENTYNPFDPANSQKLPRPQHLEDYDDLSVNPLTSDYFEKRLTDSSTNQSVSALVRITRTKGGDSTPPTKPPMNDPKATGDYLADGADDTDPLDRDDYMPQDNERREQGLTGLELDSYRDVALVYAPHPQANGLTIQKAVIDHCESQRFRFAAIDADNAYPSDLDPRSLYHWDTQYAAFYAPWIKISDPETGATLDVPPGGYALGVYARSDAERGVYKAPANEIVRGAVGVVHEINDGIQGSLNPRGVNAIRSFPARGIRVWGARTLSSNGLWKYVSVRRLFIFLEHSIYDGTQWVVFEPNDDRLWARVKDTLRLFLRAQWREGALFGRTEAEAFFITCDRTTMTQDDILNGRLICEIGIAPVRPAEFVIFRIFQNTAEAQR